MEEGLHNKCHTTSSGTTNPRRNLTLPQTCVCVYSCASSVYVQCMYGCNTIHNPTAAADPAFLKGGFQKIFIFEHAHFDKATPIPNKISCNYATQLQFKISQVIVSKLRPLCSEHRSMYQYSIRCHSIIYR